VEQLQDLDAGLEVQLARGLVREQDRVSAGQRPRDRYPLLLAAQQLVGEVSRSLGEPDAIQHRATSRT
jgi:hypothetical protein